MEHFFQCPYCWEEVSMILDSSVASQTYIEDCEVCCNPIEVHPVFEGATLVRFDQQIIGQ
jgi:hypothetical protein